jgi:peroxiredoxin
VKRIGVGFPLLSDEGAHTAAAYGVALAGMDMAVPAVIVVRRDRTIAWKRVGETLVDEISPAEVLAKVKSAAD